MKTTDIGLFISSALGSLFLSFTPATAVTLVEPIVTTPRENISDVIGLPPGLQPSVPLLGFFPPNDTSLPNLTNETGYTIDKLSLLLLPEFTELEDDLVWGDVNGDGQIGSSNIFTNINIAPDFPVLGSNALSLELTNGTIQDGKTFAFTFLTSQDLTPIDPQGNNLLLIGTSFEGSKAVPEPSNVFAFALTIALGYWLRKRRLTKT